MGDWERLLAALLLQGGYNSAVVAVGAGLLGVAAGGAGAFIFLRRRALVSDAVSHATLPGVALAFMIMAAVGADGRWLPGLMLGAALSAGLGLLAVDWMSRRTRLSEDAAIGAVLSVFFGAGIVLLTVVQTLGVGRQAGLEGFLLGSTAGMLWSEAATIAVAGGLAALLVFALRRPLTLAAFDPGFAAASGVSPRIADLAMMGLALAVTVIGLKIVGLVLIVALLIIPPAAARFWSDRVDALIFIAAGLGGLAGYLGAALSAAVDDAPTGALIVLIAFCIFMFSMLAAPKRGAVAALIERRRQQLRVHRRQGLLAMARGEPIYDRLTISVLRRERLLRADGVATEAGRAAAAKAQLDEARWSALRRSSRETALTDRYDGVTPIEDALTPDQIAALDALARPRPAAEGER